MSSFLEKTVEQIIQHHSELNNLIIVIPTKRSALFIKRALTKHLKHPIIIPEVHTFDSWVEKLTQIRKISKNELLFEFYKVYKNFVADEQAEPFDTFINWASVVLEDFNTIDKNLTPVNSVFDTLKGINNLYNWQWEPETELTQKYKTFLQHLSQYYHLLNNSLSEQNLGYQGMIFREAIEELPHFIENTKQKLIFIGNNTDSIAEQKIIIELLHNKRAEIYFENPLIYNYFYAKKNIDDEIRALKITSDKSTTEKTPNIDIVGINNNVGIAKYVGKLLQNDVDNASETAVVLLDENLLLPIMESIPQKITNVNITMGVSLFGFPVLQLILLLFRFNKAFSENSKNIYYTTWYEFLKHNVIKNIDSGFEKIIHHIQEENKIYITPSEMELLTQQYVPYNNILNLWTNAFTQTNPSNFINTLIHFLEKLKSYTDATDRESLFKVYQFSLQMLLWIEKYDFINHIKTVENLYYQFIKKEKFYFIGQPLQGLQIMGFSETRLLPFKKIILISANSGILPPSQSKDSFIPFDVRKYYNLPTRQEIERHYAFLFYSLIENAEHTTIIYNTDTNNTLGGGEKSHFLEQLLLKYPLLNHKMISIENQSIALKLKEIEKTPEILCQIQQLFQTGVSPSALSSYVYNPIDFYKQKILGIKEQNDIEETIADNTLGTVVHEALETIYKPFENQFLSVRNLEQSLENIPQIIQQSFQKNYLNGNITEGKNRLIAAIAEKYVKHFIQDEIKLIEQGNSIKLLYVEHKISANLTLDGIEFPVVFKGIIDRIDSFNNQIRIIDFKTGKVDGSQLRISNFDKKIMNYKYSKAMQVMLYATMFCQQNNIPELQAGIISFKNHKEGFIPVNFAERGLDETINYEKAQIFLQNISYLLAEILNPAIPFTEKLN